MKRKPGLIVALVLLAAAAAVPAVHAWHRRQVAATVAAAVPPVPDLPGWPALARARLHAASVAARHATDPNRALRELAGLYRANLRYAEARPVELGLATLEPMEARWRYYLSDTERNLGDMAAARAYLEQARERAPRDRTFHLRLAELLFKEGDPAGAEREYRARLAAVPGDPYARLGLARTALAAGRATEAQTLLEAITQDMPEFPPAHNLLAQMYAQAGEATRAEDERRLGTATGRFREADDPWLFRLNAWTFDVARASLSGVAELRRQELANASRLCREAIRATPTDAALYQALGAIHIALGWVPDPTKPIIDLGGDLSERMARGRRVFETVCFACHMPHGEGQAGIFPPLANSDFMRADKTRSIAAPVRGLTGTIVVNGRSYTNTMLPQTQLTTAQLADVLTYVMNTWGNDLGAVTGEDVEAIRRAP